jgi:hypothetical protein
MTERPPDTRLHDWLDDTVGPTPNPVEGTRQVMSQAEKTSQVGRWLPFPALHRRISTRAASTDDTTEYRPSPIPASNGHTPTVIGRTQTMISPAKAIIAGTLVFAVGGVLLIAQPFDRQGGTVPGAAVADPGPAAYVHGTMVGRDCCGDAVETFDDDGDRLTMRGMVSSGLVDMDDPRLSGTWEQTGNLDEFPQLDGEERVEIHWAGLTISNDEGSWNGTCTSTYDSAAATETSLDQCQLTGEGAYEGLSALLAPTSHAWPSWTVAGAIFPGPVPPDSAYDE